MTVALALAAWIGAALLVLSDGRRGMALGLGMVSVSLAVLVWATGQGYAGGALLAGGLVAAGMRYREGPPEWGLMEPGSTPRIILTVVAGVVSLWIAVTVASGDAAAIRFAVLVVLGLSATRLLQARDDAASLTATAAVALTLGTASVIDAGNPALILCVLAGLVAAFSSLFRLPRPLGT